MRTVAVVGRKGGGGKTTIATHLAIGMHLRGRRTLLADADPQRSAMDVLKARRDLGPEPVASSGAKLFALKTAALRAGVGAMIIDTPAVLEEEVAHAVVLSDLTIIVVRPTFLDLSGTIATVNIVRQLRRPGLVVLNQAPVARENVEPPLVKRSIEALRLMKLPVAPVVLRARLAYQSVLESGRSAEELTSEMVSAEEMREFCSFIERFIFGAATPMPAVRRAE